MAHGTPPHISEAQYNVPNPTLEFLVDPDTTEVGEPTASVFVALVGLTGVLGECLQYIYNIKKGASCRIEGLELYLNNWIENLTGSNRVIILRGSRLEIPGAASLRLAYLTIRLLLQRMQHEAAKQEQHSTPAQIENCYLQARRTAEEILMFTQELQLSQLGGFWQSVSTFSYPATVNFLLRCALETESSPAGLGQNAAFRIARDLIDTLRSYQHDYGWDVGDVCLAQHAEIVDKISAGAAPDTQPADVLDAHDFIIPDVSFIDPFFPNLWDPLQSAW